MKLTVLVDNHTYIDMYYLGEPALSFYIEDGDKKFLFDSAYSDVFIKNASKMKIDLQELNAMILSHGHNDHSGGLQYLRKTHKGLKIIAHPDAFAYRQDDTGLPIGSPLSLDEVSKGFDLSFSKEPLRISEHLYYLGQIEGCFDFEKRYPIGKKIYEDLLSDDYILDDTALAYKGKDGLFIITGCSHSGICNIIEQAKRVCNDQRITGVIGGFHLFENDERLQATIDYLAANEIRMLYPCHCVSLKAKTEMAKRLEINEVGVGLEVEID